MLRPQGVKLPGKIANDSDWCTLHDHIQHCQMIGTLFSKDDIHLFVYDQLFTYSVKECSVTGVRDIPFVV